MTTETKTKEPDRYDRAIAYLREHPGEILAAWDLRWYGRDGESAEQEDHPAAPLFETVGPRGILPDGRRCGCLTQLRDTDGLTAFGASVFETEIRLDHRIPTHPREITLEHLPVFAEWQRKIDAAIPNRWGDQETNEEESK